MLPLLAGLLGGAGTLRAADRAAERAAYWAADRDAERAAERAVERIADRIIQRTADQTTDQTADRAAEIVAGLSDGFRTRKGYVVRFAVEAGGQTSRGRYAVEGENYCLTLGDAEVFGDGKLRYEVDNRRREITVDRVDAASRNILDNPVHAFDFLDSEYGAELLWERDGRAAVRLTPRAKDSSIGHVTVTVSTASMQPLSLAYDYDGERIDIAFEHIGPPDGPLRRFARKDYADYEFIDFR